MISYNEPACTVCHLNCATNINRNHNICKKFNQVTNSLSSRSFIEANLSLPKCFFLFPFGFVHLHAQFPGATGKPEWESPKSFIDGGTQNVPYVRQYRGVFVWTHQKGSLLVLNKYANMIFLCHDTLNDVLMHTEMVLHESIIYFAWLTSTGSGLSRRMGVQYKGRGQRLLVRLQLGPERAACVRALRSAGSFLPVVRFLMTS